MPSGYPPEVGQFSKLHPAIRSLDGNWGLVSQFPELYNVCFLLCCVVCNMAVVGGELEMNVMMYIYSLERQVVSHEKVCLLINDKTGRNSY
jgi:hypothetical protein